jgi:hypothetical protein
MRLFHGEFRGKTTKNRRIAEMPYASSAARFYRLAKVVPLRINRNTFCKRFLRYQCLDPGYKEEVN